MNQPTSKEEILELVRNLPDEVTTRDVMEALYFFDAVNRGLEEAEAGRVVSHEAVKRQLAKWLKAKKRKRSDRG